MDLTAYLFTLFLGHGTTGATPAPAAPPLAIKPVVMAQSRPVATVDASKIVDEVQGFYQKTQTLTAKFRQVVVNATFGKETKSDGFVYIKKPGKMRWDYFSKAKKDKVDRSFMSDGKVLWAVFMDGKTYYKKNLKDDVLPVAITFLSGKGDLKTDFTATLDTTGKYGAKGDHVLSLSPKKPSAQYKTLWLVVDPGNFRVKQSVILNSNNDVTTFSFYEPDTAKPLKDQTFVFNEKEMTKKAGFRQVKPPESTTPE